eukprot:ANDGO_07598.mRNA.1 hypothetical protein
MKVRLQKRAHLNTLEDVFRVAARAHLESAQTQRRLDSSQRKAMMNYIPRLQSTISSILQLNTLVEEDEAVLGGNAQDLSISRQELAELRMKVSELKRNVARLRTEESERLSVLFEQQKSARVALLSKASQEKVDIPISEKEFLELQRTCDWDDVGRRVRKVAADCEQTASEWTQLFQTVETNLKAYENVRKEQIASPEREMLEERGATYHNFALSRESEELQEPVLPPSSLLQEDPSHEMNQEGTLLHKFVKRFAS